VTCEDPGVQRTTPGPDTLTVGALGLALVSVSSSGPLIAYAAAPALAIAFWRNAMAVGPLVGAAALRRRAELRGLIRSRSGLYSVLAGVALAAHFGTWVPSTKLTSVATATALVATQPIWQGLIAVGQGRRLPPSTWVGIAFAICGVVFATGADVGLSGRAVLGDVLALVGGALAAVYTALGERARTDTSTTSYTVVCYSVSAMALLVVCLASRQPLYGFPASAWWALVAITVGPQLMGHSMLNFAVKRVPATTISVLVLLEVPGAALIAWLWLGQVPTPTAALGVALLVVGVLVVIIGGRRARLTTAVPAEI
jgi:drug/metabolite transporter (DMT)-like permease